MISQLPDEQLARRATVFPSQLIVSKTPVRISFGGGGTDLAAFYAKSDGLVISATIDKYFCCVVSLRRDSRLVITSADYGICEECDDVSKVDARGVFGLVKAVVRAFRPPVGLDIHTASDIPPGSGLGLSGAATVGTIKAVSAILGRKLPAGPIAELASTIEIEELKRPIGKQDQYASSFGGLNEIRFSLSGTTVTPLGLDGSRLRRLEKWTMLFFTGKSRDSATILLEQRGKTARGHHETLEYLREIKELAERMKSALLSDDLARLGELVDSSWQAKRRIVSTISSSRIDELYETAKRNGAFGGKITGAGGGGFLMLVCPPENGAAVETALTELEAQRLKFRFVARGAHIAN
ncbi:MAG: GHMP kinase [Candidatus Coatesbacteria bacterium]|nr:GHMP kinase [Candidatus Coatesbacteria bacterium]